MLYTIILAVHIIVSLFLILIVLLQAGKGAGMGAAFGGGSSTVFGGRGAGDFLSRLTTVMAAMFMILSIVLARFSLEDTRTEAPTAGDETEEVTEPPTEAPPEGATVTPKALAPKEAAADKEGVPGETVPLPPAAGGPAADDGPTADEPAEAPAPAPEGGGDEAP